MWVRVAKCRYLVAWRQDGQREAIDGDVLRRGQEVEDQEEEGEGADVDSGVTSLTEPLVHA